MKAFDQGRGAIPLGGPRDEALGDFVKRLIVALLIVVLALTLWKLASLVILLFAAILIAVGLHTAATRLSLAAHIGHAPALALVTGALLAAVVAALWFFGAVVANQFEEVARQVPAGVRMIFERLQGHPYGRVVLEQARAASAAGAAAGVASRLAWIAQAIGRALVYGVLTFFVALYLAAQPERYRQMCLRFLPNDYRAPLDLLFDRSAEVLRRWLLGQLVVMATIGLLSGLGLQLLGIEAAFALGLAGGLLTFIPYVGAVLAAVPATLVALTQGPTQAALVVMMYVAIHIAEGNFITPFVQAEATSLPPVLALISTVGFSILFGPSAVLLAAPMTLFLITVVEVLGLKRSAL